MQRINKSIIFETKELHKRNAREKLQKTIVEGFNALSVAIATNQKIVYVIVDSETIIEKIQALIFGKSWQFEIYRASSEELLKCSTTTTSYEVVTVIETPSTMKIFENDYIALGKHLVNPVLAYENIQDPGNLGTIIRTACAFGFEEIWLVGECVDPFSPKVIRSSSGYTFNLHSIYALSLQSLLKFFQTRRENTVISVTKSNGEKILELPFHKHSNAYEIMRNKSVVYMFGNEGHGISNQILNASDYHLAILHDILVDSLNVAVATSIVAYELYSIRFQNPGSSN